MDITHRPRYVTCEVCCGKDSEEYMLEFDTCFVHNPECLEEWDKSCKKESQNGSSNMVE
jgi:hypothetical protein